jgi:hypothetical protein
MVKPGDRFSEWEVLSVAAVCKCRCSCGRVCLVYRNNLTRGKSKRCKTCRRRFKSVVPERIYLKLKERVVAAISRCSDLDNPDYGGRGIKVFGAWLIDPGLFIDYLATLPGHDQAGLLLDRINNNGDYEPGNLRFVTPVESAGNRRPPRKRKPQVYKRCNHCRIRFRVPKPSWADKTRYCSKSCYMNFRKQGSVE